LSVSAPHAQRDPLQEYKSEAFELFQALLNNLRTAVTSQMTRVELVTEQPAPPPPLPTMQAHHVNATTGEDEFGVVEQTIVAAENRDPQNQATWAKSAATKPARVVRARNTSIATVRLKLCRGLKYWLQ